MNEAFLQYVWQHGLLEGPLATVDGLPVVVERAGELNRDAGPDFFAARLLIDGVLWVGNVEVHIKASDWKLHHHSSDKNYNNVILHVVYVADADIVLEDGSRVATLSIADNIPERVWENYNQLMNPAADVDIPCAPRLKEIPPFLFKIGQERLSVERMERKSGDVKRLLRQTKGSWEQTCYWLTAHYFGGKTNAFAFELLAKVTPMNVLAKFKDNPFRVESLFFGQAGMLDKDFADDYPRAMKHEYSYQSAAYNLTPMPGHLWKFFRLRPPSFPTLRISQFAALIVRSSNLFSRLLDTSDVRLLRGLFDVGASDYWHNHYQFDKPAAPCPKIMGNALVDSIIINAWVPLLFQYGVMHDDQNRKDQAFALLEQLPPEDNRIVRLWQRLDIVPNDAFQSQALIERYNEYCNRKRCLDCHLAFRLLKYFPRGSSSLPLNN